MTFAPAAVPTLDAIAARPEVAKSLPRETLYALSVQALAALQAINLAIITAPVTAVADHDQVLDVAEAARRLGIAPKTLQGRARQHPYNELVIDLGVRRLQFSSSRIEAFKHRHAGSAVAEPAVESPRRKSGRSPGAQPPRRHLGYALLEGRQGGEDR